MRKYFIGFFLSVFSTLGLNAQSECLTPSPTPPAWIFSKSTVSTRSNITSSSKLNIFVHIVRSSNGTGLTTSIIQPILSSLNSYYQGVIQFNLLGSDFIDNDIYYVTLTIAEANQLFNVNNHCNAIDIYILGTSTSFGGAGMAQNIPSKAYIVHGSYYNTSSLPHEMGHCLGLYHTHHGTINEGGDDINQCSELVNGINSSTCGDYITDTPADPNVWSETSCTYTGTGVDANGQAYNPSTSNLMSYAYKPCRTNFSNIQIQRIIDFINNTQILQNTLFSTISGQTTICSSETYTVNDVPTGCTVYWTSSLNITLPTDRTTNSIVATANGSGSGWVQATINSTCGSVTLPQFPIWAGVPPLYAISGPASIVLNSTAHYTADFLPRQASTYGIYYYDWAITSNLQFESSHTYQTDAYIKGITLGLGRVGFYTTNGCGTSTFSFPVRVVSAKSLNIYPNPASEEITIEIDDETKVDDTLNNIIVSEQSTNTEYLVNIYDNSGMPVFAKKYRNINEIKLNISKWQKGLYRVMLMIGNEKYAGSFIIE